ncbi:Complex I intermediate-associated protein 30 (CIA30) [Halopseudomonas sabulinigri]|uniref:Complex I intermediate-associated protein 30 (CIA30) n=1 Tax=Halopseudomonas sabulinigri TaxID=472181 RepID=A0A1H1LFN0_9GAMM|nr:CIA30 family protein [Halopseudomonas sabulinigri]SDR73120.1 Complex I intermediate-associated protein 30 (CIA30) [Halopseudomonas sabulinigri]
MQEHPVTEGASVSPDQLIDVYCAGAVDTTPWRVITDEVMGGVSTASLQQGERLGSPCTCLHGRTRLENDGGFVQMKHPVAPDVKTANYTGIFVELAGPAHEYELRVKTSQLDKPWQSFRHTLAVTPAWTRFIVPYSELHPHRTEATLAPESILSVAIVAIGTAFDVDVGVRRLGFYR